MHILFVCVGNACRSQMAQGFARSLSKGEISIFSAGIKALGRIYPQTIEVMKEVNIDIGAEKSKALTYEMLAQADVIVCMMGFSLDHIFNLDGKKVLNWKIRDPFHESVKVFRSVRDEIKQKVEELIQQIRATPLVTKPR